MSKLKTNYFWSSKLLSFPSFDPESDMHHQEPKVNYWRGWKSEMKTENAGNTEQVTVGSIYGE